MAGEGKLAGNIRARLDESQEVNTEKKGTPEMTLIKDDSKAGASKKKASVLEENYYGKPKRIHVQEFACIFAIIAFAVAGYKLYYYADIPYASVASLIGAALVLLGYRAPIVLYPLWKGWMALAHVLGTCMTFLILSAMWFVVALPIAVILKVIGKKVMDLRYDQKLTTYWEDRPEKYHDFKLLERQF